MWTDKDIKRYIRTALKHAQVRYPQVGIVKAIDSNLVDIQVSGSPAFLRNVKVIGDPNSLAIGDEVQIVWSDRPGTPAKAPTVIVSSSAVPIIPSLATDEVTITKSSAGLAVKNRGIGLKHLDFEPALNGHNHSDMMGLGGWQVTTDGILYNGTTYIHPSGMIVLGTGNDILYLATEGDYRMWAGNVSPASAPYSLSKTGVVRVGAGTPNIVIDGPNATIKTSDFSAGYDGWQIDGDGDAEFANVTIRGALTTAVFVKGLVEAHAGTMVIAKSAGKLAADYTIGGVLTIEDPPTGADWLFDNSDRVHIRSEYASGIADVWITVTRRAVPPYAVNTYTTVVQSGTSSGTIPKGAAALDYGQSGQGVLLMTADNDIYANAPYYEVFTHAGSPWSTQTRRARLGNLTGITYNGAALSGYGLWTDNAYLEGDLVAAGGDVVIDDDGIQITPPTSILDKNSITWKSGNAYARVGGYFSSGVQINLELMSYTPDAAGIAQTEVGARATPGATNSPTMIRFTQQDDTPGGIGTMAFYVKNSLWLSMASNDNFIETSKSIIADVGDTVDLGSSGVYFNHIYARTIHADTIEGEAMSGQAWEYAGTPMYIRPNNAGASEVQIVNPDASYSASLYVEGNITLGGTVDGVDISSHASNTNAHHNRSHSLTSSSDHTATGSAFDLLGLTGTNVIGLITPSSNPGATEKILKTASDGSVQLALAGIGTAANSSYSLYVVKIDAAGSTVYGSVIDAFKRGTGYATGILGRAILDTDIDASQIEGIVGRAQLSAASGTPSITNAWGIYGHAYHPGGSLVSVTDFTAGYFNSQHDGTGSVANQYGVYANLSKGASAPAATVAFGFRLYMAADVATTKYSFHSNLGTVVFNDDGDPGSDFKVEGDTDTNLIFADASGDTVGIGTGSPSSSYKLTVAGTTYISGSLGVGVTPASNAMLYTRWVNTTVTGTWYAIYSNAYNRIAGGSAVSMGLYAYADQPVAAGSQWGFYSSNTGSSTGGSSGNMYGTEVYLALSNTHNATSLTGHRATLTLNGTGTLTTATGVDISMSKGGTTTPTNAYGINIGNIAVGTNNYAIVTNAGNVVFNEGGDTNTDFRVESDTQTHAFFVDAGLERVGIKDSSPYYDLDVTGEIRATGGLRLGTGDPTYDRIYSYSGSIVLNPSGGNVNLANSNYLNLPDSGGNVSTILAGGSAYGVGLYSIQPILVGTYAISPLAMIMAYSTTTPLLLLGYNATHYLDIQVDNAGSATISTTDDLVLDPGGNVGINKAIPTAKLDVVGSVLIDGGTVTVNEAGEDYDFRVESLNYSHMLFLDASADSIGINKSNPAYTLDMWGVARFMGPAGQIGLTYDGTFHTWFDASATGSFEITTATGIIFDPGGNYVNPGGNIEDDLGTYNTMWRSLYAAELIVQNLVQQDIQATIGGAIRVAPTTTLTRALGSSDTTIYLEHAAPGFVNGTYIIMQGYDANGNVAFEAMKLTSAGTDEGDDYSFTVTRNLDGTGANSWDAGRAVVSTGDAIGEGHIDLTSTQTLYSHVGPTIALYSRTATTNWNDVKPIVALGNLYSFLGYGSDTYGMAIGNDLSLTTSTFRGATITAANGLQLYNTDITLYDSAVAKVQVKYNEGILVSSGTWGTDTTVFAAVFADDATVTSLDAGDVIIGTPFHATPGSVLGLHWDSSRHVFDVWGALHLYGDSTFDGIVTISTSGELRQGTGSWGSTFTGLRLWNDTGIGRIGGYNSSALQWYASTDGKLYAGAGKVKLDYDGLTVIGLGSAVFWKKDTSILGTLLANDSGYSESSVTYPVSLMATNTDGESIVVNGGFESGATGWDEYENEGTIDIDTNSPVYEGSYSAKIKTSSGDLTQWESYLTSSSYITASAGSMVSIVAYVYYFSGTGVGDGGSFQLQILWYNSSNSLLRTDSVYAGSEGYFPVNSWTRVSGTSPKAPSTTAKFKIRLRATSHMWGTEPCWVYFDSVSAILTTYETNLEIGDGYVLFDIDRAYKTPSGTNPNKPSGFYFYGGDVLVASDIYRSAWASWSPTTGGWSGTPTKTCYYKRVGKLTFVAFEINGTSTTGATTMTLPTTLNANGPNLRVPMRAQDNGTWQTVGMAAVSPGSNTVTFYKDMSATAFATSGAKIVSGEFIYESA